MLLNSILFAVLIILCYGCLILAERLYGKAGIFAWIAVATVVSNITAASIGPMLGIHGVTLANVPFATVFLSTQILSICYGREEGTRGVYVGLYSALTFVGLMMVSSYLVPESYDSVTGSINHLFSFGSYNMCNTVASVSMFFLANLCNVLLFNKLRDKLENKHLWIAKNVATITTNCLENFAFVLLGLYLLPNIVLKIFPGAFDASNLMPIGACLLVAVTTCIFEITLSVLDTPVLYLMKKLHNIDSTGVENKNME